MWGWYAWSYLISPATAACNIVHRHIKIMESYVQAPQVHINAARNPKLAGGPFINLDEKYLEQVIQLLECTKRECIEFIELEKSIKELGNLLQKESGSSLEPLYKDLPNKLKGLVELVYDLNNKASLRLIEPLLYHKYDTSKYQMLLLSEVTKDFRPFVLSTPCLAVEEGIKLNIPYKDNRLDNFFSMRYVPGSLDEIEKELGIVQKDKKKFKNLFTLEKPEVDQYASIIKNRGLS